MLELRGGRQEDVGVVGGVGEEHVVHDREQIAARKASDHLFRIRGDRHRVGVVDEQRADRGLRFEQRIADRRGIDRARVVPDQIGPFERLVVHRVEIAGRQQHAAGRLAPGTHQRRQTGDGAHGRAAAAMTLQAEVDADRRGFRRGVFACQPHHRIGTDAADASDPLRRIFLHALLERIEAERVVGDVVGVDPLLVDDDVHHPQCKSRVGAGQRRNVLVALLGREAAIRIDRDHLGSAPLGLLHARPVVQIGGDRVRAPDEDELRVFDALRVHADAATQRDLDAGAPGRRTQRPVELRCAQVVEEAPIHAGIVEQAHRARVAVGADRLRPVGRGGDRLELRGDGVERLVPVDSFPAAVARTFTAHAPMRIDDAILGVGALQIARDLGAQRTRGERMVLGAGDLGGDAVLDGRLQRAGVRAIVRARAFDDAHLLPA